MNNKIVSLTKKRISAIFLATVLIAGTIALSFPSFMTIGAAQAQQYYEMDNDYNSYEPEYPSYKPDYKPQYPSYGKDDRDKSNKDNSKSIDTKKIKCINTNLNINGNNAGNVSIGNKGQVDAEEGYVGSYSSGDSGYGDERYYDGYNNNKKDKDIVCIIDNNNNNTNVVADAGGGNVTIPEPQTCEECFERFLTEDQIDIFLGSATLEDYCDAIESGNLNEAEVRADLANDASMATIGDIIECLQNLGILPL